MKMSNSEIQLFPLHRTAIKSDVDNIISSFTDPGTLPYPSQRFPAVIENKLPVLLMSALFSAEKELIIYCCKKGSYVAFTLCEVTQGNNVIMLLAGVWPAFRGRGVFRQVIEKNILQTRGHHMIVMCGPGMDIAQRQLRKLGFSWIPDRNTGLIYHKKNIAD